MKLFLKKSECEVRESLNGEVWEVETYGPIYIDGGFGESCLMFNPDDGDGLVNIPEDAKDPSALWPFLTPVPKNFKL